MKLRIPLLLNVFKILVTKKTIFVSALTLCLNPISIFKCNGDENQLKDGNFTERGKEDMSSITSFGMDIYRELCSKEDNLCISPFDLYGCLLLASHGSTDRTAKQFKDVLRIGESSVNDWINIRSEIQKPEDKYNIQCLFSIWISENLKIKPEYLQSISDFYNSSVNRVNFSNIRAVREKLSTWLSQKTNKRIDLSKMSKIASDESVLLLTSTLYYEAKWEKKFHEKAKPGIFYITESKSIEVPIMSQEEVFRYFEDDVARCLELPYKNGLFSMLIGISKERKNRFESKNNDIVLERILSNECLQHLEMRNVKVEIPKFELRFTYNLSSVMKSIGLHDPFIPNRASFGNLSDAMSMHISEIVQSTWIAVHEEGSEMAAASIVDVLASPPQLIGTTNFKVDCPFVFVIIHNRSKVPLALGRVLNPKGNGYASN